MILLFACFSALEFPTPTRADCVFDSKPGSVTIDILYEDSECLDCGEIPTLEIDAEGFGSFSIRLLNETEGTCERTATTGDDYFSFGSIFTIEDCPKGDQTYAWTVYNPATQVELPITETIGDPTRSFIYSNAPISSIGAPFFPYTGDYEIRRYFNDCGDESFPGISAASSYLSVPLHVEVDVLIENGAIRFEDSLSDGANDVTLADFAGITQCAAGLGNVVVDESVRYICSRDDPLSDMVAFASWDQAGCGVEEMTWERFSGTEGFGFWVDVGLGVIAGGETFHGSSLSAEAIRAELPTSGYVTFRRRDRGFDGQVEYTNELTIVVTGTLRPDVTPTAQDICAAGTVEDLVASYDEVASGAVRYQWQGRLLSGQGDFVDLPGRTEPTMTPSLPASAEYRVQLWQSSSSVNVAPLGTASQSTLWPGTSADRAIDGNQDGNFYNDSVTATATGDPLPWWSVQLDQTYDIDRIGLWNRNDCCRERLTNLRVTILDEAGATTYTEDYFTDGASAPATGRYDLVLPEVVTGRTVRLELFEPSDDPEIQYYLQLAEVEVFAVIECGPYTSDAVTVTVEEGGRVYYPDADGDGYPNKSAAPRLLCEVEDGWVPGSRAGDCSDANPNLYPGKRWYFDEDGDGLLRQNAEFVEQCQRPQPFANWIARDSSAPFDCDDSDPTVRAQRVWAEDKDGDGYSTGQTVESCAPPLGYRAVAEVLGPGDCDDTDPDEFPGRRWFPDLDGDGVGSAPSVVSCSRPEGHFLAEELTGTDDCDDGDPDYFTLRRWYRDADGDGYPAADASGEAAGFVIECRPSALHDVSEQDLTGLEVDCDDDDPERFPGQAWYPDGDGDGLGRALATPSVGCEPPSASFVSNHRDCDDTDADPTLCEAGPDAGSALRLVLADEDAGLNRASDSRLGAFAKADFQVEAWIRTSSSRGGVIVSRGSACGDANAWSLGLSASGVATALLLDARGQEVRLEGETALNDDQWHHVALRRVAEELTLWVDLAREDFEERSPFVIRGTDPVIVGNDLPLVGGGECGRSFVGWIDDVRIWVSPGDASSAISNVLRDLHRVVPGDTADLVVHWSFDSTVTGGQGGDEVYASDSAQGFPLLLEVGGLVTSTAPLGVGTVQQTAFFGATDPSPDLVLGQVGLTVADAALDGPVVVALTTRLDVRPSGPAPGDDRPLTEAYWIVDLLGPSTTVSGELTLAFATDAVSPELASRPGDVSLYTRPANSAGEWTFVATATQVDAARDQVRFGQLSLERSQLLVTVTPGMAGALDVTQEPIEFGAVAVGSERAIVVPLTNVGGASVLIDRITVEGTGAPVFSTADWSDVTLAPAETLAVPVTFAPAAATVYTGMRLVFESSAIDSTVLARPLSGRGVLSGGQGPVISLDADELDFGAVSTAAIHTRVFTVGNSGTQALEVMLGSTTGEFTLGVAGEGRAGTLDVSVPSGGSVIVEVAFQAPTPRAVAGAIEIRSNDPSLPFVSLPLFARAIAAGSPALVVSPRLLELPATEVGDVERAAITLSNGGEVELEITGIALEAPAGSPLSLLSAPGTVTLGPGGRVRVAIEFAPDAAGLHGAELVVSSNDPASPERRIPIAARGLSFDEAEPSLLVGSDALDFDTVPTGGEVTRSVSLRSEGSAAVEISALSIEGVDASSFEIVFGGDPGTLAPGTARWVTVAFRPTSARAYVATLRVDSDDPERPLVQVALSGDGAEDSGARFRRADTDGNGTLDITDGIFVLRYLFLGGDTPGCLEAADCNDSGLIDIADGVFLFSYLFLGGSEPPAPGPSTCGPDPSPLDGLGCESYSSCGN